MFTGYLFKAKHITHNLFFSLLCLSSLATCSQNNIQHTISSLCFARSCLKYLSDLTHIHSCKSLRLLSDTCFQHFQSEVSYIANIQLLYRVHYQEYASFEVSIKRVWSFSRKLSKNNNGAVYFTVYSNCTFVNPFCVILYVHCKSIHLFHIIILNVN